MYDFVLATHLLSLHSVAPISSILQHMFSLGQVSTPSLDYLQTGVSVATHRSHFFSAYRPVHLCFHPPSHLSVLLVSSLSSLIAAVFLFFIKFGSISRQNFCSLS